MSSSKQATLFKFPTQIWVQLGVALNNNSIFRQKEVTLEVYLQWQFTFPCTAATSDKHQANTSKDLTT